MLLVRSAFYRLSISFFGLLLVYQGEAYRFAWFGALNKGIWLIHGGVHGFFDRFSGHVHMTTVLRMKEMGNLAERAKALGKAKGKCLIHMHVSRSIYLELIFIFVVTWLMPFFPFSVFCSILSRFFFIIHYNIHGCTKDHWHEFFFQPGKWG